MKKRKRLRLRESRSNRHLDGTEIGRKLAEARKAVAKSRGYAT